MCPPPPLNRFPEQRQAARDLALLAPDEAEVVQAAERVRVPAAERAPEVAQLVDKLDREF